MATANDIISGALTEISSLAPGDSIPGDEANRALAVLNRMMAAWSAEPLMKPYRTVIQFTPLAAGVQAVTVGPSGDIVTTRPDRVTDCYLRDSGNIDYPVDVTMTSAEYNAIAVKTVRARPCRLFFDPQMPNAILYFDYAVDQTYTMFLEMQSTMPQFAALASSMTLPPEYEEGAMYLLAERLAPSYGFPIPPDLRKLIEDARNRIKNRNAALTMQPVRFDAELTPVPLGTPILSGF